MNFCRNCGKTIKEATSPCSHCRVIIGTGQSYCPDCGAKTPGGAFCSGCGRSLLEGGMTHEAIYQEPVQQALLNQRAAQQEATTKE